MVDNGTDPEWVLLVAVGVGVVGLPVHLSFDSVAAIGGAVGGWLVWRGVADSTAPHPATRREMVVGIVVLVIGGEVFGGVYALEPAYLLIFLGIALAGGLIVGAPVVSAQLS